MHGRNPVKRNSGNPASKFHGQKKKNPLGKLIQKKVTKEIMNKLYQLHAKEQHLIERQEEILHKTKGIPAISIGRFRLTPSAKNPREHQQILFELQNGMMPKKILQFSEIRELAKRNPVQFGQLFDLVYKYFTGEITKKEIESLTKFLKHAIEKGKNTDQKMAGIIQLKKRRKEEIDFIQSYHKAG